MKIQVNAESDKSMIYIERDCRFHVSDYVDLDRKVMIISDDGVPSEYVEAIYSQCKIPYTYIVKQGEQAKSLENVELICRRLYELDFCEKDLIFAVGGGVIGDLSGYIASIYHFGIPLVSMPTTTLSQIDSSIGGKTAVNLNGVKNIIGLFYQPSVVLIDLNTLATLDRKEYYSGFAEAIKAGLIRDAKLFSIFERHNADFTNDIPPADLEAIIYRSLLVKKQVVEEDEKETGIRKILNFGHTLGHAIESIYHLENFTHGECVGIGMMMILENEEIKEKLGRILDKMGLPIKADYDIDHVLNLITDDKKAEGKDITIVQVDEIGKGYLKKVTLNSLREYCQ